ncbi:L-ribulose-5-phosphate 3-epimerase [Oceanotoga teriensis]|uniref:L-ribulose-5-phosphate 3-epimerase n=1 Tax=Oceanotoga teriensis TaxID=515440 RepID=UPI0027123446|nr:L-ribulose-5-phosphate 3-epimerase [Oceanotoga teriensis]MDO7976454.1 L-ribulose-5-phosphate 3-epimerase [Oceanotoga teriensis]
MNIKNNHIGIYEKAIPDQFNLIQKIEIAKQSGFDFIELSIDESEEREKRLYWSKNEIEELIKALINENFEIRSLCLSIHRKYPFGSKNEKTREKSYKIIDKALELSKKLGIKNIQIAGYDVYYEKNDLQTKENFINGLKYAVKKAEKYNVMLSIEIMDTPFIGTITRCLEYINIINSPYLKIYPDLGNLSRWSENPELELIKGMDKIVAIHLKDTKEGVFKNVPFGQGTVDFKKLLKTINTQNYTGPFLIEMWADNSKIYTKEEIIIQLKETKDWIKEKME